jgi:hypothetical protein
MYNIVVCDDDGDGDDDDDDDDDAYPLILFPLQCHDSSNFA